MGKLFDEDSIFMIIENVFFKYVEGEWNEWRVERNWKVLRKQIKEKIMELDKNKERE